MNDPLTCHNSRFLLWPMLGSLVLCGVVVVGCKTMRKRGIVPQSVVTCRQLSRDGVSAMEHGHNEKACTLLAEAVETSPTDIDARRQLAEALWCVDRRSEAVVHMETAVRLDERHAPTIVRAGQMLLDSGDPGRALLRAEQGIGLDVTLADAWALRGRYFSKQGDWKRALADLQQALHYAPQNTDILFEVALVQSRLQRPQRCLTSLHHLLDRCAPGEESQRVLWLEGQAYQQLGRPQDALHSLMAATERGVPQADLFHALAEVELLLGRREAAEISVHKALALDSQHVASHSLLARLIPGNVTEEDRTYLR